ncbi:hypothetical protein BX616_004663 [Lobosporangium transversale]|nr:hypothetical protein BX616_004663 [Lobosporangium transversale]
MFWIDDPTLSIGLMVVPTTDDHSTQTGNDSARPGTGSGNGSSNPANSITTAPVATFNASTSTTALPMTSFRVSKDHLSTTSGLANIALTDTSLNSPMSMSSTSGFSNASSTTTLAYGSGGTGIVGTTPTTRMNLVTKGRAPTMSSVNEKEGQESMDEKASQPNHGPDLNFDCNHIHHHHNHHHDQQQQQRNDLISTTSPVSGLSPLSESRVRVEEAKDHLSLKMDEA